ncbi:MAG: hypothetical protein AB1Z57_04150 [Acidimicrobiia bacterium]
MILTTALLVIGGLIGFAAWIWLLVVAFRVSVGWGLLILLLGWTWIPIIIFAVTYWDLAKRPIMLTAVSVVVSGAAYAIAVFVIGMNLESIAEETGGLVARPGADVEADRPVLPPPRPTALPTHPSWEAIVREVDRESDDTTWEEFVPSPTSETGRPNQLRWSELNAHVGRAVNIELVRGTPITAALEGAEADRVRIRHVIGGGEASYWIDRDQITSIRLVN